MLIDGSPVAPDTDDALKAFPQGSLAERFRFRLAPLSANPNPTRLCPSRLRIIPTEILNSGPFAGTSCAVRPPCSSWADRRNRECRSERGQVATRQKCPPHATEMPWESSSDSCVVANDEANEVRAGETTCSSGKMAPVTGPLMNILFGMYHQEGR